MGPDPIVLAFACWTLFYDIKFIFLMFPIGFELLNPNPTSARLYLVGNSCKTQKIKDGRQRDANSDISVSMSHRELNFFFRYAFLWRRILLWYYIKPLFISNMAAKIQDGRRQPPDVQFDIHIYISHTELKLFQICFFIKKNLLVILYLSIHSDPTWLLKSKMAAGNRRIWILI